MGRLAYRLVLVVIGVGLYLLGSGFWIACALLLVWSLVQQPVAVWVGVAAKLADISAEHAANTVLQYTFSAQRVLEHPAVDGLFERLRERGKAPAHTLDAWRHLLLSNLKRKYPAAADGTCEVRFNIKSNLLFVNGEIDFGDYVFFEWEIPYRWNADGTEQSARAFSSGTESHLSIRVLVVNGDLKLQVGRFEKAYTPRVLHSGSLGVYETYATVTSFPLLYFSYEHALPVRYLNLVPAATRSYKEAHADGVRQSKNGWKTRYVDWRSLNRDIGAYRVLCDQDNANYSHRRVDQLAAAFEEKRTPLMTAEGYETYKRDPEDAWRYPDTGHTYWNRYGQISFRNMNANRDSPKTEHWFTDYYEELP